MSSLSLNLFKFQNLKKKRRQINFHEMCILFIKIIPVEVLQLLTWALLK